MTRLPAILFSLIVLLGCTGERLPHRGAGSPLVYDAAQVARSDRLAIFIPGAFASIDIFDPARVWADHGYGLVYYRFPGTDRLALDHAVAIEQAAADIARFANAHPDKELALVGYSTGGPIALRAASAIRSDHVVNVAAISSAVENAGGLPTALRGATHIAAASAKAGSFDPKAFWPVYWQTLLYGQAGLRDPARADQIARLTEQERASITIPDAKLAQAHSADLRRWRLPDPTPLNNTKVGFFVGERDPVFSTRQTLRFVKKLGTGTVHVYPDEGHLLFLTRPDIFQDILKFIETK